MKRFAVHTIIEKYRLTSNLHAEEIFNMELSLEIVNKNYKIIFGTVNLQLHKK